MANNQRPTLHIKTPGAMPQQEPESEGSEAVLADVPQEAAPQAAMAVTPEQLKAMIDAAVAGALKASGVRAAPATAPKLPDQSAIDIDKITEPVLSAQGYVLPRRFGAVPDHLVKPLLGQ
jgi:hypothetical protein